MTEHDQCDLPIFYLYKGDDGRMHKTSKELTEKLNRITITKNLVVSTEYYPQWPEPDFKSQTRPAWKITADGERVVRWYRRRCQHNKTHGNGSCKMINDKECARACAIYLQWDEKSSLWVQAPLIDKLED